MSNSLQLMKKWHRGLEQTKRHLWLRSLEPQTGQNSHQFSCFFSSVLDGSDRFMISLRGMIWENHFTLDEKVCGPNAKTVGFVNNLFVWM